MTETSSSSDEITDEENIPNPGSSLIYFIVVTFAFIFFTVFSLYSGTDIKSIEANSNNSIFNLIYIILVIGGSYIINLNIAKALCNTNNIQWNNIFFITVIPWIIIFGIIYFLLELFPAWINPFSNTIGYLVVNFLGAGKVINSLLTSTDESVKDSNNDLIKAINNLKNNKSKLINEFDIKSIEFEKFISKLKNESIFNIEENDDDIKINSLVIELYKLINIKHIIGKLIWYILSGILIASISYNYIINITCEKTLDEVRREYEEITENNN